MMLGPKEYAAIMRLTQQPALFVGLAIDGFPDYQKWLEIFRVNYTDALLFLLLHIGSGDVKTWEDFRTKVVEDITKQPYPKPAQYNLETIRAMMHTLDNCKLVRDLRGF